ncbi:MAG: NAD(P)(+) transhydrogenase (Re/Si-specific) subunit beta [Pirellulales bacterium]|nr:NAD(P)(+) transhydrogenase (Re/Si-specific) subunit beta [Pirellulales bacterium]
MASATWANLGYLISATFFIFGIKGMTHPRTAVRGNMLGAIGMILAVLVTLWQFHGSTTAFLVVLLGVAMGTIVGVILAAKVQMTQMPQLVALLNGFGGIASLLVAGAEVVKKAAGIPYPAATGFAAALAGIIGAVTFSGSIVAAGKLHELPAFKDPIRFDGQQIANALLVGICLILAFVMMAGYGWPFWLLILLAGVLGVLLVSPIGGADMPVVIALLNSYSGLAACAAGFVINNNVLIIAGALVGASGLILTGIMCRAMNRSLAHVLFGTLEAKPGSVTADEIYSGKIKETSAEEIAMLLDSVQRVVFVPGYGLAVAQAQHIVRELAELLEARGAEVCYGIHPVAGRMPGHMNVLLAEAEVPYDQLKEMDEINPLFPQTDVVIVIGANDVVNPVALTDPNCPIYGMPILTVHEAKTVIVIKRSLSPGFAGIPNPLFAADNCLMYFGDGKKALNDLIAAVRES